MSNNSIIAGFVVLGLGIVTVSVLYLRGKNFEVFNPKGTIAAEQSHLMILCLLLSLVVVIPVFTLLSVISWRYREGNKRARKTYSPDFDGSRLLETVWWLIPTAIIVVISVINWQSSHQLDPFRPIASTQPAMTIQVVALDWKWLFIYPQQHVATVNYVRFPVDTPVDFEITSDAPMNSFWIPQLGGQIYAMAGMSTHLNLMANQIGDYRGSSANISGAGFANMIFAAQARTQSDFSSWLASAQQADQSLGMAAYNRLAQPGETKTPITYSNVESNLYDKIVLKYMGPSDQAVSGGVVE
jgi:cytochrome o ubiquinol oxidase subunit 2